LSAAVLDTPRLLKKSIGGLATKEKLIIFIDNRKNFNRKRVLGLCPTFATGENAGFLGS
jgi:hypothetical protein